MLKSLDFPGRYLYVVAMRIYPWDGRILGLQRQMRKRNSNLRVDDLTKPRDRHKSENMAAIHSALHKSFTETFIPTLTCSAVTCRWALIYLLTSLSRRQQVYQPSYKDDFRCMTVAAALSLVSRAHAQDVNAYLVVGEYQRIGNNHVFSPARREHNDLGDVVRCQRLNTFVNSIGFRLVTTKPY